VSIHIRPAVESDLSALADLFLQGAEFHVRNASDKFRLPSREWAQAFLTDQLRNRNIIFLVAELDAEVIGEIRAELRKSPDFALFNPPATLQVEEIVVDSACRRRGVAKALMAAMEKAARNLKADQIVLNVWQFNEAARKLYHNIGYDVQRIVMEKDLR